MLTLGVESSCDETAAAVVEDGCRVRSNVIHSQVPVHARYGGVVPELASRNHVVAVLPVIEQALSEAGVGFDDVALIAATVGPGLAGSLLVGLETAKVLAWVHGLPLIGVNHLEGHLLSPFVDPQSGPESGPPLDFPYLALIVSGGHSALFLAEGVGRYRCLGRTLDDAAGEAFDKVAKRLGGPYPGGPWVERTARGATGGRYQLPSPMLSKGYDFSFSGLKTAANGLIEELERDEPRRDWVAEVCHAVQVAVVRVLVRKLFRAVARFECRRVAVVGGVACNGALRRAVHARAEEAGVDVYIPAPVLCTDNGAMIACAGALRAGRVGGSGFAQYELDVDARLKVGE